MVNNFGQEVLVGDYVLYSLKSGYLDIYLVYKFSEGNTRASLLKFHVRKTQWIPGPNGVGGQHEPIEPYAIMEKTQAHYPESMFRTRLEEDRRMDPLLYQAFDEARRKILNGQKV